MKTSTEATHQNENDKAKKQANQHHRVDDRQPMDLHSEITGETQPSQSCGCEIKSGSGLGTGLVSHILESLPDSKPTQVWIDSASRVSY